MLYICKRLLNLSFLTYCVEWGFFLRCNHVLLRCRSFFVHGICVQYTTLVEGYVGRDSSVSIATRYGPGGPGIQSRWGRNLLHPSRPTLGPTQPPVQWIPGVFPGGKAARVCCWPRTHLGPGLKSRAVQLLPLWAFVAGYRVDFTVYWKDMDFQAKHTLQWLALLQILWC
jgi:hypothetical protein